jgi:hypothetical protein
MSERVSGQADKRQPFERRLSEYTEGRISWLWRSLVPSNAVVLFEGEARSARAGWHATSLPRRAAGSRCLVRRRVGRRSMC